MTPMMPPGLQRRFSTAVPQPVPAALRRSPLLASGGFRVYRGVPDVTTCRALLDEAIAAYAEAVPQENRDDDVADGRGGRPRRALLTGQGARVQDALYASAWLSGFLSAECGVPIRASGNRGSYSYYVRAGDFLDLHLDVLTCDVAVITALHDASAGDDPAGALVLYPSRMGEPLSAIRARPRDGACCVKLRPTETVVMFGGLVPHRVLPVHEGQARIISVLCFEAEVDERRLHT